MRILVFHNRLDHYGGPETYLKNIIEIFESNDHEVILLGHYKDGARISSTFRNFVIPGFGTSSIFGKLITGIFGVFNPLSFLVGLYASFVYRPDLAIGLQYRLKLSSSIIIALKLSNTPLIHRLSDFNYFCAKNVAVLNGNSCHLCVNNVWRGFSENCLNSRLYHFLDVLERLLTKYLRINSLIDLYVVPSANTLKVLTQKARIDESRIRLLPTPFVPKSDNYDRKVTDEEVYIVLGRASVDKGIEAICEGFLSANMPLNSRLIVVGERDHSVDIYSQNCDSAQIEFKDKMSHEELDILLGNISYVIAWPAWDDNLPNSLIECCVRGIVAIVPNSGCFNSLKSEGMPGLYGTDGSAESLVQILTMSRDLNHEAYNQLSDDCKRWMQEYSSSKVHYDTIIGYYEEISR